MKRPSRSALVQGATVLLVVGCAVFFADRLSTLSDAMQARQTAERIHSLQQQLQRIDHELEGMQPFKGVLKEDFQHAQQSLLKRLGALETTTRTVDSLAADLTAMSTRLQHSEGTLLMLQATVEKCSSTCPATPTAAAAPPGASTRPKARKTNPVSAKPSPPPFTLLGLESRAGETFLAVLPQGLQRLGDVHLLRPGMLFQGWRLTALDSGKAHWVKPDGSATAVSIP
ncbi:hypothetical protein ACMGT0_17365 [Pseudomonas sp. RHF3.3-3]|uniref:hypothetical protein n=1 Tax=Pseudomonas sp. RHF3.3-3 TaxID=3396624 RepID=UPI003A86C36D